MPTSVVTLGGVLVAIASGCGTSAKAEHPVVGPPPPRIPVSQRSASPASGGIQTADAISQTQTSSELVATVNGQPIFASEVLERFRPQLEAIRAQQGQGVYEFQRQQVLVSELAGHVEQLMLNQKVREKFGNDIVLKVEEQLDGMFGDHLASLKAKTGSRTLAELEEQLNAAGTSIGSQRRAFSNKQLAEFYLMQTLDEVPEVRRRDIVERYNATVEKYDRPETLSWQQLTISFDEHGSPGQALKVLEQAVADLDAGESFDVVVGRYSDGMMKDRAGLWEPITRGALKDRDFEDRLFALSVGEFTPPVKTDDAFIIARVAERTAASRVPFKDVQNELQAEIENERREQKANELIAELWDDVNLTTAFDDEPEWQQIVRSKKAAASAATGGLTPR